MSQRRQWSRREERAPPEPRFADMCVAEHGDPQATCSPIATLASRSPRPVRRWGSCGRRSDPGRQRRVRACRRSRPGSRASRLRGGARRPRSRVGTCVGKSSRPPRSSKSQATSSQRRQRRENACQRRRISHEVSAHCRDDRAERGASTSSRSRRASFRNSQSRTAQPSGATTRCRWLR